MKNDLTTGPVLKKLIAFAIPFFISYLLQALYGGVDILVTGQFCEVESIAAVNVGSQIMQIVTCFVVGISVGSTVVIGNAVGAKDNHKINKTIFNTIIIAIFFSIILTIIFIIFPRQISILMKTPELAIPECTNYILICAIGIPFIILYNEVSGILRAFGDSKSPLYAILVSCIVNIIGDICFAYIGYGVFGIAISTVLAEIISSIFILLILISKKSLYKLDIKNYKTDMQNIIEVLNVGIPVALQDSLINISFLILTAIINLKGVYAASGAGIVERILSFMFIVPSTFLSSISVFASQNEGAKKHDRSILATKYSMAVCFAFAIIMCVLSYMIPNIIIGFFTNEELAIKEGISYLQSYVFDTIFVSYIFPINGYLAGTNRSIVAFIHSIIATFIVRIPFALIFSSIYKSSLFFIGLAAPIASITSILILIIYFHYKKEKVLRYV